MKHSNYWFETCDSRHVNGVSFVKNVDVLIVGGGISGMSLLFQLARSKSNNVYLAEESAVGYHASGRSSGQLMLRGSKYFTDFEDASVARAYALFLTHNIRRFTRILQTTNADVDLHVGGGLRLACDEEEFRKLEAEVKFINKIAPDTNCITLDRSAIKSIIPSDTFVGGAYIPIEATLNPYKLVNNIRRSIESVGPRIYTNATIESVTPQSDGSLSVSIRHKGVIRAKKVVYCTNAYTPELLPEFKDFMVPFRGQMISTDVLPEESLNKLPTMSMSCNYGSEYFRTYGNRLLIGGKRNAVRGAQRNIIYDGEVSQAVFSRLRDFLNESLPFVNTKVTHTWGGIMCETKDGLPLVGQLPDRPNEYIMAGFNGYGISHAFLSSVIMRDLLLKGKTDIPGASLFFPTRHV
jgi:glycine/D-amino acid oxidase-like deaminating enzyme